VASGSNLIALKVFKDSGSGSFAYLERALQWVNANAAVYNIASVNLSLGDGFNWADPSSHYGLGDEFAALASQGIVTSAAAGNSFYKFASTPGLSYPGVDPNVIPVGAVWTEDFGANRRFTNGAIDFTTAPDRIASFSQRELDGLPFLAPGILIDGARAGGGTLSMGGTSQATAFVSALATIAQQMSVAAIGRRLSLTEFKSLLAQSSNWLVDGDDENDNVINTGASFPRVNALRLAEKISALDPSASPVPGNMQGVGTDGGSSPIPSTLSLSHTINLLAGQVVADRDFGNQLQPIPPTLSISVTSADQSEGNLGSKAFSFTVSRSGGTTGASSAAWVVTSFGSNPADASDFSGVVHPSGTVNFAAGDTSQIITVQVSGDTEVELDEGFTVTLTSPSGATIASGTAIATIRNDDVVELNKPPTAVAFTNVTASLAENTNTSSRIKLADIAISDDALGTNTFSLLGADVAAFEVEGTVLYLKAGTSLNYESKTTYAVTVSVADNTINGSSPVIVGYILAVTDVNEKPTALALSATAFDENIPAGSLVASLSSSDPDSLAQSYSYALVAGTGDTDNLAFYVTANELHITRSPDYELKSSYKVRLRTTDQEGLSFDRNVQLAVNDLADSPSYSFSTSGSVVYEGSAINIGISSQNVAPGTKVYWSLGGSGITGSDVTDGIPVGTSTLGADGKASFIKTIAADGVLEGDEGMEIKFFSDSNRSQQLGSTLAVTLKEPSVGTITDGPDIISGTAAAEIITGVPFGSSLRGKGTVDKLTGGAGNDIFLLGDSQGVFYDDGNSVVQSTLDLAWITDFASGDKIGLYGSVEKYQLVSARYTGIKGVQINALLSGSTPEPIGFVQSSTLATLTLTDPSQFTYF
jgi:Subtilase family